MIPRSLLALLAATGCIAPPSYELTSSASSDSEPEHDCCLHPDVREVEPWGRESLGAERVNRAVVHRHTQPVDITVAAREAPPAARPELDLGPTQPSRSSEIREPPRPAGGTEKGPVEGAELARELLRTRQDLEDARRTLADKERGAEELLRRVESLHLELDERDRLNQALATRLVQAQIRRLEAEKALIEHELASERARVAAAPPGGVRH